jgi:hypothetical protein
LHGRRNHFLGGMAAVQNTALLAYNMGRALYTPALQIFFASLADTTDWNLARKTLAFLVS